ncbi:acyl-CoA thioesterase [Aquirufa salirivi]|uniref:Acyl-CoA thioesterase n=1 Tax=Aquirufa salirivi TaxID=3104729 RepID=A0ABW8RQ10_9BACT
MTKTPSSTYIIRFNDCDLLGHLNNSRYLDYFMNAREDHLRDFYQVDLTSYFNKGLGWVVSGHEIAYIKPAFYNEVVCIQSSLLYADSELLFLETIMMNESQSHLKAIMRTKLIPISTQTGKKSQHPSDFLNWAKSIENEAINHEENLPIRLKHLLSSFKAKLIPFPNELPD